MEQILSIYISLALEKYLFSLQASVFHKSSLLNFS